MAGKAGKLNQCITIIKSTNCIHVSDEVASPSSWFWKLAGMPWITCQDFLNTSYLTIISEFPASTVSSLSNIQAFLVLIPTPSGWLRPGSPLSLTNQTKASVYIYSEPSTLPLTSALLLLQIMTSLSLFFFKLEASCWNLASIHLKCERSRQVQATTHTRKKDSLWFPNYLLNYGFRQMTDVRYWIMYFWKWAVSKCSKK